VVSAKLLLNFVLSIDACLLLTAIVLVLRSGASRQMGFFGGLLGVSFLQTTLDVAVMFHRKSLGISPAAACDMLKYGGMAAQGTAAVLLLLTVYSVFGKLMEPFPGLQRMGGLVFRWVGAIAVCLACMMVFGPHSSGATQLAVFSAQFQEGVAVLTLCMLLAVSLATRPLGLSVQSRLFGTLLGLGVLCTCSLVSSTWFSQAEAQSPYAPAYLIGAFGSLLAAATWSVYFARPEPVRRMITLPTTSPFFFWNRIAEALGDAPGEVAVGGISPDMFAPAELMAFVAPPRQPAPVVEMPRPQVAQR